MEKILESKKQVHIELEKKILSRFILDPTELKLKELQEKFFLDLDNRKIYEEIKSHGEIAIPELGQDPKTAQRLFELMEENSVIVDITRTVNHLKESYKTIQKLKAIDNLRHSADIVDALEYLPERIKAIESENSVKEISSYRAINAMTDLVDDIENNSIVEGKSTGFPKLDAKLGGGLFSGLIVLGAISSLGKTTLAINIAENVTKKGNEALFFSLEMGTRELVSRILSRNTYIADKKNASTELDIKQGRSLKNEDMKKPFEEALETFMARGGENLYIVEGGIGYTVEELRRHVERHIVTTGNKPVVFVDYLQILRTEQKLSDKERIDFIVTELKRISRDMDVAIIAISSFNRTNYMQTVSFESFKESGGIEYTADVVLGLELSVTRELKGTDTEKREALNRAKASTPRDIRLVCMKNRNGESYFEQKFSYVAKYNTFFESEKN